MTLACSDYGAEFIAAFGLPALRELAPDLVDRHCAGVIDRGSDVIGFDDTLVRGSHGLDPATPEEGPIWIGWPAPRAIGEDLAMTDVKELWLGMLSAPPSPSASRA